MKNLYYQAPESDCFQELKEMALEIWASYDDTYGYATEKISRIKDIGNINDNFMYMVAMFDSNNQRKLASMLSDKTKKAVAERLTAGGASAIANLFI